MWESFDVIDVGNLMYKSNVMLVASKSIPAVSVFQLDAGAQSIVSKEHITLSHKGWDVAFEETGGLWVLQENQQIPLLFYQPKDGQWQVREFL